MDFIRVMDFLYSNIVNVFELGDMINDCRRILATNFGCSLFCYNGPIVR
jgi:hypothetical protein